RVPWTVPLRTVRCRAGGDRPGSRRAGAHRPAATASSCRTLPPLAHPSAEPNLRSHRIGRRKTRRAATKRFAPQVEQRRHTEPHDPGDVRAAQRTDERPDIEQLIKERYLHRERDDVAVVRPPLDPPVYPVRREERCTSYRPRLTR